MSRGHEHEETTLRLVDRRFVRLPSLVLVATAKDGSEIRRPLTMTPLVVGTAPDTDLAIDDPAVSRRHCMITLTSRGVIVRDLQSKNGTSVGGAEIIEAFLALGGYARIGGTTLRLHRVGPPTDVPLWPGGSFGPAIGGSIAMRALFAQLDHAARTDSSVLLRGETGTGKQLLARALHEASARREGPFVVLDADRPDSLTGAAGGTLFIDELADLTPEEQSRILRALDAGGGSLRVVAATAREGTLDGDALRKDLYFRLAAIELRVPPLRDRREDIEVLAEHFLAVEEPPRRIVDLPPGAIGMLNGHDWPGNVRELKNAVARLAVFPGLGVRAIPYGNAGEEAAPPVDRLLQLPLREARELVVERFEAHYLLARLEEHGGNVSAMAVAIGLSRQMVHRLLAQHGIGDRFR